MSNKLSITRKKRKSMSLDMKMKILNRLEEREKHTAVAKAYGINESTVRTVRKRKENIKSSVASGTLSNLHSDNEETDSFTAENLCKALEFVKKLEIAIIDIDPNIQRALKFRQNLMKCCSEYQQICENLVIENTKKNSSEKIYIHNENEDELPNISSDEDEFMPIKKKRLIVLNYSSDSDIK
ncbi:hypothetical protein ANTPLA_LOCUS6685 [Anthophora plagiata]